jgi:hypothetical protein
MSIYYLYLKTHNQTGLKYLGRTVTNPYKYKGSGTYWRRHLSQHGSDITTEVLKECNTLDEVKSWGNYYSKLWNVAESKEFANLMAENGEGRGKGYKQSPEVKAKTVVNLRKPGVPLSESHKAAISKAKKEYTFTEEHKLNLSKAHKGQVPWNKGKKGVQVSPNKGKKAKQVTCPHCGKTGGSGGMSTFHFDKCKYR